MWLIIVILGCVVGIILASEGETDLAGCLGMIVLLTILLWAFSKMI